MLRHHLLAALLGALACACASPSDTEARGGSSASMDESIAPRPFTAAEIRDANPAGTVLVFRLSPQGQPEMRQRFEFHETDGEVVRMGGRTIDAAGAVLQSEPAAPVSWVELRDHATFPADATVLDEVQVEVPAGAFRCKRYTVTRPDGQVEVFHFADDRPGPPVLMTIAAGGAEVFRMELLEVRRPGA